MPLLSLKRATTALVATTALCAAGASSAAAQSAEPYGLGGYMVLNGSAKGTAQVGGPIADATFAPDGTFSGRLSLGRTNASPVVSGWLFANLRMEFDPDAPITGTWKDGAFKATAKVTVRFPRVVYFGFLVGSGANCKTREPATLTITGRGASFDPARGDTVSGTLPIGPITGCGPFTSTVQSLLSSSRHTFTGYLTPPSSPAPPS